MRIKKVITAIIFGSGIFFMLAYIFLQNAYLGLAGFSLLLIGHLIMLFDGIKKLRRPKNKDDSGQGDGLREP